MTIKTITTPAGAGHKLADKLSLKIVGIEGHDLKVGCVACTSSDGGRVHEDTGAYFCYVCSKALSGFDLAKVVHGDHAAAIQTMIDVGLFEPQGNGTGKATPAGIFPHHWKELQASGLTAATVKAAGIRSEASWEVLASIVHWKYQHKMGAALVFPYIDAHGVNGYTRIKPDRPRKLARGIVKYESPRGYPNRVYLPPGVAPVLADATARLFVTEGEKKALAASQEGFLCLGLPGVFSWKPKKREALIDDLEAIAWNGRPVYITFDSDIAVKPEVKDAAARLAAVLKQHGANVKIIYLPDGPVGADGKPSKMGLDDYLVAHGPAAFEALTHEAQEPPEVDEVKMKTEAGDADPAFEAKAMLAKDEQDGLSRLRFWQGSFLRHSGGCYLELANSEIRARIVNYLNSYYRKLTASVVGNVIDQMKAQSLLPFSTRAPAWIGDKAPPWPVDEMLVAKNGIFHLPSIADGKPAKIELTPRLFSMNALDYEIDPAAPIPSKFMEFLSQLWPDDPDSMFTLLEWVGYCVTADTAQQKILMLIGPKRSGKGTIARITRAIVGPENVCGPTLSSLTGPFGMQPLLGKTLAIVSDARLSGRADQTPVVERLLAISGEDAITVDRKNVESVTTKLGIRFMLISNELPRLSDSSGALASRMLILRLTQSFYGRENPSLTNELLTELPGILRLAIDGWRRLRERGYFVQPDSAAGMVDDLEALTSPVGAFIRDCCAVGPGKSVAVDALYAKWCGWCKGNGRDHPGTPQTLGRDLLAAVSALRTVQPRDNNGNRYRAYEGVALV